MPKSSILATPCRVTMMVARIWVSPAAGGADRPILTRLTSEAGLVTDPAISPGGKFLAYAYDRSGAGTLDIWIRQIPDGTPVRLTNDLADSREPSFSPDGRLIAYTSARDRGGIYVVPALSGESHRLADGGHRPRFSPDGQQLLFGPDPTSAFEAPSGSLFQHFHDVRLSLRKPLIYRSLALSEHQIVLNLNEPTGNVWMLESPGLARRSPWNRLTINPEVSDRSL